MHVFISWYGNRSKAIAEALADWLPSVIQAVEPWVSQDIEKGARWSDAVAKSLDETKVGIICLTSDNLSAPWINFEAGAISKNRANSLVCTFLVGIKPADVAPPLGQFQHTEFNKEEVFKLIESINEKVRESTETSLPQNRLSTTFEKYWPDLEVALNKYKAPEPATSARPQRTERDLLEEILELLRNQQRESTSAAIREAPFPNVVGTSEFNPVAKVGLPPNALASFNSPTFATQAKELVASFERIKSLGPDAIKEMAKLDIPTRSRELLAGLELYNKSLASEAAKVAEELSKLDIRKIAENLQPEVKATNRPPKDPKKP